MRKLDYELLSDADLQQILERSAANFESGVNLRAPTRRSSLLARILPRFFRPRGIEQPGRIARLADLGAAVGTRIARPALVAAGAWLASLAAVLVIRCRDAVRWSRSHRRRESKLPAPPRA